MIDSSHPKEATTLLQVLLTAALSFAATNLDDIFILMLLFSGARDARHHRRIVLGQFLGMGVLTLGSLLGAAGLGLLPDLYLRLLGLVPFGLGLRAWLRRNKAETEDAVSTATDGAVLSTALLTIANGGDNLGVYLPLFAGYTLWQSGLVVLVFGLMTGLWCLLGSSLARLPKLQALLHRYSGVLVPWVLMLLGLSILLF